MRRWVMLWLAGCIFLGGLAPIMAQGDTLAILNGRVMDPETGLDAVRHLLIRDGRIARISSRRPRAERTIDAEGLIVAPGFIDLHAHGQDAASNRYQAADGVTTALELEIGTWPVQRYLEMRKGRALINYGTTVSHPVARFAATEQAEDIDGELMMFIRRAFASAAARRSHGVD